MQDFRNRLVIATVILGIAFLGLVSRLWFLQVLKADEFEAFSRDNRIRIERVPASRGRILDRYGRELVVNRPSFDVYVLPEDVDDMPALSVNLSRVLNEDPAKIVQKIKQASRRNRFKPALVAQDINRDQLAYIEARRSSLPGLTIEVNNLRQYPHGVMGASFLGYIGKVSEAELLANPELSSNGLVGKTGVEKTWEQSLRGKDGFTQKVTDALGREVKSNLFQKDLVNRQSVPGNDVVMSVDIDLQKAAEDALGEEFGAIIAVNVRNGEVLALASKPSFDPADFVKGIDSKTWSKLMNDKDFPLVSRATQGLYAPGSVFKMVPAAAAMKEGAIHPDTLVHCPGYYRLGSHVYRCWKRGGHGWMNMREAIVQSCDVYFYKLADKLGIDRISRYMNFFGFGSPTGIGIEERAGVAPSREWKLEKFKKPWYKGETIVSAIGQGYVSVTPLQIVMMTAAIANGGTLLTPNLVIKEVAFSGETRLNNVPPKGELPVDKVTLALIRDAMTGVVNGPGGTGHGARLENVTVAGKTGTAQVVSLDSQSSDKAHKDHAWFTSFAPAETPEIAVTVLIEHGGKGGAVAAPIAKKIIETYFQLKKERKANDNV
ncbi:MAG: penicillin-binding protein 2 [Thermodesulfobacteriota bacterium]